MNTLKTLILMALLTGIMVAVGGSFGGTSGATVMLLISLGMNLFSYWFSAPMVLRAYGAQEVTREEAPELYGMVEQLAANAHLPMPKLCIINSDVPTNMPEARNQKLSV